VVPAPGFTQLVGPEATLFFSPLVVFLLALLAARSLAVSSSTVAQ
jgi:hypothetical protein